VLKKSLLLGFDKVVQEAGDALLQEVPLPQAKPVKPGKIRSKPY